MEKFADIETAQDLFEFLSTIPESTRRQLAVDANDELSSFDRPSQIGVEAIQIFEDGCPIEMLRLTKIDIDC